MSKLQSWEHMPNNMNGTGMVTNGNMWGHPHRALARMPNGKIGSVRLNQEADTYFGWSGRASVNGRTVRGVVQYDGEELTFTPYKSAKDGD